MRGPSLSLFFLLFFVLRRHKISAVKYSLRWAHCARARRTSEAARVQARGKRTRWKSPLISPPVYFFWALLSVHNEMYTQTPAWSRCVLPTWNFPPPLSLEWNVWLWTFHGISVSCFRRPFLGRAPSLVFVWSLIQETSLVECHGEFFLCRAGVRARVSVRGRLPLSSPYILSLAVPLRITSTWAPLCEGGRQRARVLRLWPLTRPHSSQRKRGNPLSVRPTLCLLSICTMFLGFMSCIFQLVLWTTVIYSYYFKKHIWGEMIEKALPVPRRMMYRTGGGLISDLNKSFLYQFHPLLLAVSFPDTSVLIWCWQSYLEKWFCRYYILKQNVSYTLR